jgi:hypothetical protein
MPTQPSPGSRRSTAKTADTKSARPTRSQAVDAATPAPVIDPEQRRALIAQAAYLRAERRNFAPGFEQDDWLSAESEVDTLLTLGVPPTGN